MNDSVQSMRWDLAGLFPDGFSGEQWTAWLGEVEAELASLIPRCDALCSPDEDTAWADVLGELERVGQKASTLYTYAYCRAAENVEDPDARRACAHLAGIWTRIDRAWSRPEQLVAQCSDAAFAALCEDTSLARQIPRLRDVRKRRHSLLPEGEHALMLELSETAIGAWSRQYSKLSGDLVVDLNGESLSVGQAFNRLNHPSAETRGAAFEALERSWRGVEDECAEILSNLTQSRQVISRRLGVRPIELALARHRLEPETLDAMLHFCREDARPLMHRYVAAKARALGCEELNYADLRAPVGRATAEWSFLDARHFIVEQFAQFSPSLAAYAERCFTERWIEAEDRAGKRQGAFCTSFRLQQQSRVFMTWSGTTTNLITLAHELGHAWHNEVMWDLAPARNRVPSTLAETASTFAEAVVRSGAMKNAEGDPQTELALLESELQAASVMLQNIPTRVLFEQSLYPERARGPLNADRLSAHISALQSEWYGPRFGRSDDTFWCSKLHFYLEAPFYNYPYTFGYLFSALIHARALEEGPSWAEGYVNLLRDTGAGPCEAVAAQHLGVDLRHAAVWRPILAGLEQRVARYEALVEQAVSA